MLITATTRKGSAIQLGVRWEDLKVLLHIGIMALGLIAVQLLPILEYRDRYVKETNIGLSDSRGLNNILLDFVDPDPFRPGGHSDTLRPEEFYAYTGWWPLIGMVGLPLGWKKNKRSLTLILALILFSILWIDVRDMPWHSLFQNLPVLYQFRYPSRMVAVGGMALIIAGGLGLNGLQEVAQKQFEAGRRRSGIIMILTLGVFLLWSLADVALTCRPLLTTTVPAEEHNQVSAWLKQVDPGLYYVQAPNGWDQALIKNQLRYQNGGYAIHYLPEYKDQISKQIIVPQPEYMILSKDSPASPNASLIKSFENFNIYRLSDSLPFAFSLSAKGLASPEQTTLLPSAVDEQFFQAKNTDKIEGTINNNSTGILILLITYTPNWRLNIDGRPAKTFSAYGYLAANAIPGQHHYEFFYSPPWFYVGLAISLLTLLLMFTRLIMEACAPKML
jgi:hypothetical protein